MLKKHFDTNKFHALFIVFTLYSIQLTYSQQILRISFDSAVVKCSLSEGVTGKSLLLNDSLSEYPMVKLDSLTTNEFTIGSWINVSKYPDAGKGVFDKLTPLTIFSTADQQGKPNSLLRINKQRLEFVYFQENVWKVLVCKNIIEENQWYHCAAASDGKRIMVYLNGKIDSIFAAELSILWSNFYIGRWAQTRRFIGRLDEIAIFSQPLDEVALGKIIESQCTDKSLMGKVAAAPDVVSNRYGEYKMLKVTDDTLHPFQDALHISATIVPWKEPNSIDILASAQPGKIGARNAIYHQIATDHNLPVYDSGHSLKNLKGNYHQTLIKKDGMFDLVAMGNGTIYDKDCLIYLKNIGKIGSPEFADPVPLYVDGRPIVNAITGDLNGWYVGDIDNDGINDLVFCVINKLGSYAPDKISFWGGKDGPNQGKDRGYDINGNWLGADAVSSLMWAKGSIDSAGALSFGPVKKIHYRVKDFAVQWKAIANNRAVTSITLNNITYIVVAGDIDKIKAFPIKQVGDEFYCDSSIDLLGKDAVLENTYFPMKLTTFDIDSDGNLEMLVDGNPGRISVLKGDKIGEFSEVGCIKMKGGFVAVDTLATPCRVDWNNDGFIDLLIGDSSGFLTLWPGTKDWEIFREPIYLKSAGVKIHHQAGYNGSIQGPTEARWGYLQPTVGDWDDDGVNDIITNNIKSELFLYQKNDKGVNLREAVRFTYNQQHYKPAWRSRPAILNKEFNFNNFNRPVLLHLDWDGDLAVAIPQSVGNTNFEKIIKLCYKDGSHIRLCHVGGNWGRTKLSVADWDGDGDWDVLLGTSHPLQKVFLEDQDNPGQATPRWLENIGSSAEPVFENAKSLKLKNGDFIKLGAHNASVWPTDLNRDGKLDIIVGAEDGKIYYFLRNDLK